MTPIIGHTGCTEAVDSVYLYVLLLEVYISNNSVSDQTWKSIKIHFSEVFFFNTTVCYLQINDKRNIFIK